MVSLTSRFFHGIPFADALDREADPVGTLQVGSGEMALKASGLSPWIHCDRGGARARGCRCGPGRSAGDRTACPSAGLVAVMARRASALRTGGLRATSRGARRGDTYRSQPTPARATHDRGRHTVRPVGTDPQGRHRDVAGGPSRRSTSGPRCRIEADRRGRPCRRNSPSYRGPLHRVADSRDPAIFDVAGLDAALDDVKVFEPPGEITPPNPTRPPVTHTGEVGQFSWIRAWLVGICSRRQLQTCDGPRPGRQS